MARESDTRWTELRQWRSLRWLLVETRLFTASVAEWLDDDEYRLLQLDLAERPEAGRVIPGCGGVRKLRWGHSGRGKRGGVRVFYLVREAMGRIYLLHLIGKSDRADLPRRQVEALRGAVEKEFP